jgi:hypothetical protein
VDFDGDGIGDILSGSWPGDLSFFKGQGKGKYAAAVKLKDKDGKPINAGQASTVFAADWRGTGKLDLLLGCIEGFVWLVPNEGTRTKPAYGKPIKLSAGGKEIRVPHGDSHPILADWEGSGKPGLVVGCGDGSVQWYRNVGTRAAPKLAAGVPLVAAPPQPDWRNPKASKEAGRGMRAKVWVGDFNGDGLLDLLVGDFAMTWGEAPKLTERDRTRQKEIQVRLSKVNKELEPWGKELNNIYNKADLKTSEGRAKVEALVTKLSAKYKRPLEERTKLYTELRKFERPMSYHGQVWLYARRPAARAAVP